MQANFITYIIAELQLHHLGRRGSKCRMTQRQVCTKQISVADIAHYCTLLISVMWHCTLLHITAHYCTLLISYCTLLHITDISNVAASTVQQLLDGLLLIACD
jgi:hypothetical protein